MFRTSSSLPLFLFLIISTTTGMAQEPVPYADFEVDEDGWYTEEHGTGLIWVDDDTAGPGSNGAIAILLDPSLPDDDSPESKLHGFLPVEINMGDYEYLSFYYKCDSEAYTGGSMFAMPMNEDLSAGGGRFHTGTMIGDGEWHYEEFHVSEFGNWWGDWSWADSTRVSAGSI